MRKHPWQIRTVVLAALLCGLFLAGPAGAVEVLQNASFESYDAGALVPDNWQVIDGSVEVYDGDVYDGTVSIYSLGGTAVDDGSGGWTVTPNTTQGGTIVQLLDLSTLPDFGTTNYMSVNLIMNVHLWCGTRVDMILEYLPATYNTTTVTADDPAWSGPDVGLADKTYYTSTRTTWRERDRDSTIPAVRWARVKFVFDVTWDEDSDFTGGDYYNAVDLASVDVQWVVPESPCADNLLLNPGFESVTGDVPTDWYVRDGRMNALDINDVPLLPAYNGGGYAGNIGGTIIDEVDYPDSPQYGSLVQLVDLSSLANFSDANFINFSFSSFYMNQRIQDLSYTVEYLPEAYNDSAVTWDDPAWDSDAVTAVTDDFNNSNGEWRSIAVGPGSLPVVRWVRVRLDVDDSQVSGSNHSGPYLGGFDQVCLQADAVVVGNLFRNAGFEDSADGIHPDEWCGDPAGSTLSLLTPGYEGAQYLGKIADGGDSSGRVYQVIDLQNKIEGWINIGAELKFIRYQLSTMLLNLGGTDVKIGLEYLPYSYNETDGITCDHAAWQPRNWVSDGNAFTNNGGDAIDLGYLFENNTVDPAWQSAGIEGWLPRVRWLRIRIDLDAADTGGTPQAGIDAMELTAYCSEWGPYSGFGNLPEASFYENPDAPDKAIPAWVGPEGDGISGGYTGQTERNYVNPVFAGFADNYVNYLPSGENIYNEMFMNPEAITGRPWNDAGWVYVIVTMGDLGLNSLADYFGPASSGIYAPGEITATFDECPIVNGPGHDFATFENGFSAGWTTPEIFAELAYVEVSSNGTDFIRFPTHSLTPKWPGAYGTIYASGVFGLTGKHINAYGDQWGTPFDLDWIADHPLVLNGTVDLNNIRYVKQVDVVGGGPNDASGTGDTGKTGFFFDSYGHVIFDSWPTWGSGGADLDAVAVMNTSATDSDGDHIVDYWDNCAQTWNDNQYDTDQDGYGNICDCDIDGEEGGDGTVDAADFAVFRAAYGGYGPERIPGEPGQPDTYTDPSENWNADADFNGDNVVDAADFAILRARYGSAAPFE
jgi:hypothetical protein